MTKKWMTSNKQTLAAIKSSNALVMPPSGLALVQQLAPSFSSTSWAKFRSSMRWALRKSQQSGALNQYLHIAPGCYACMAPVRGYSIFKSTVSYGTRDYILLEGTDIHQNRANGFVTRKRLHLHTDHVLHLDTRVKVCDYIVDILRGVCRCANSSVGDAGHCPLAMYQIPLSEL